MQARNEVGEGDLRYVARDDWAQVPAGWRMGEAAGVAVDAQDRVYVLNRGEHPLMVFHRDGSFIRSWGEELFVRPHGISIAADGLVYCTDDAPHVVRVLTQEGELIRTLGVPGQCCDTGIVDDYRTITRSGPPFNLPTNVAFSPTGEVYVADGYGNARIHRFSPEGELQLSWGEPGSGPGEFLIPHGIAVDASGQVWVADRENSRLQVFNPDGGFLFEWTDIARPCQLAFDPAGRIFVAELGYRAGMWSNTLTPTPDATGGRISVFAPDRTLLARWGGGDNPMEPGDFFAPHDLCLDSHGDLYVGEVTLSAGGNRGLVSPDCPSLQKFERLAL